MCIRDSIEVGRYTYMSVLAAHAARSGVQYAAQNLITAADASSNGPNTASAAKTDAQSLPQWTIRSSVICTQNGASFACPAGGSGVPSGMVYYVQVQVSGTFKSLFSYPGIPTNVPITATAQMRVQNE